MEEKRSLRGKGRERTNLEVEVVESIGRRREYIKRKCEKQRDECKLRYMKRG